MANEFVARNGVIALSNSQITGSLIVTDSITGSLFGTSSYSTQAATASYVTNEVTASYAISASQAINSSTASLATNVVGGANRILFNSATNTTTTSNNLTWTDNTNLLTLGDATGTAGTISKIALYTSSYGGYGLGVSPAQLDYVSDGSHVFYKNGITPTELLRISNAGDVTITGSLIVTAGITGNLSGTSSFATNANNATTASYVLNAVSASFATNATNASTASYVLNAISASYALSSSFAISSSLAATSTVATTITVTNNTTDSIRYLLYAPTGAGNRAANITTTKFVVNGATGSMGINKNTITSGYNLDVAGNTLISGSLLVTGSITAQTLIVQTVSSSVVYSSGSNIFGNQLSDTQQFTGSLQVTGSSHYVYGNTSFYSGSLSVGNVTGSNIIGRIDASNDVVAFSTSDARLKENIQLIENALDKLDNIGGYTFDWNNNKEIHGYEGHDIGVIAQEIEEVLPEIVITRDNGYKAVKYEKIVPFLIQCIKELKDEIRDLKSQK